ncbi:hypothetical protein [Nonomuraea fuscirosea]|uniref:hypothetical protein n=1 Tax=Nonomuraea fuscirosea TaxID=1291556 RepID=UPI0034200C30
MAAQARLRAFIGRLPDGWDTVMTDASGGDTFHELTAGATTVANSHRFATVRRAQRVVVLEGGRIIEDGPHDALIEAGGRYAELFRPGRPGGGVPRRPATASARASTGFCGSPGPRRSGCRRRC